MLWLQEVKKGVSVYREKTAQISLYATMRDLSKPSEHSSVERGMTLSMKPWVLSGMQCRLLSRRHGNLAPRP
jgi:hypothetical protein